MNQCGYRCCQVRQPHPHLHMQLGAIKMTMAGHQRHDASLFAKESQETTTFDSSHRVVVQYQQAAGPLAAPTSSASYIARAISFLVAFEKRRPLQPEALRLGCIWTTWVTIAMEGPVLLVRPQAHRKRLCPGPICPSGYRVLQQRMSHALIFVAITLLSYVSTPSMAYT